MPTPTPSSSTPSTFKLRAQKSVTKVGKQVPAQAPSAKATCPFASALQKRKDLFDSGTAIKDVLTYAKLGERGANSARIAVGAARQAFQAFRMPTLKGLAYTYRKALPLKASTLTKELGGMSAVGFALDGAISLLNNVDSYKQGKISGANLGGRVAYSVGKSVTQTLAGAAAAPMGAMIGTVVPPLGGAMAGSAIGYKVGQALGGGKGALIGAGIGAGVGLAAGTVAFLIPGGGQAFGAAAGAIGAKLWAEEGTGAVLDKFVGEEKAGRAADAVARSAGRAAGAVSNVASRATNNVKKFFKW